MKELKSIPQKTFFHKNQEATFGTFGTKKCTINVNIITQRGINSLSGERKEKELNKIVSGIQAGFFKTLVLRSIRCSSLFLCSKGLKVLLKAACFTPPHLLHKTKKGCLHTQSRLVFTKQLKLYLAMFLDLKHIETNSQKKRITLTYFTILYTLLRSQQRTSHFIEKPLKQLPDHQHGLLSTSFQGL